MTGQVSGKEKVYDFICSLGIRGMSWLFPEYFAKEPLRPTDRYLEYPYAISHLPNKPSLILDVGCSGSMFPLIMKAMGHKVCGIDIRPYPIEDLIFTQEDICHTHFKDNSFNAVTAISTIEHIGLNGRYGTSNESSDFKAIEEIHRILKPGGTLIMTVPYGKYCKTKFHRIYEKWVLDILLREFDHSMRIVDSPEADYKLALIFAVK